MGLFSIGWTILIYAEQENNAVLIAMIAVGVGLVAADGFGHVALQRLTRFAHPLAAYGLLMALLALAILQLNQMFSYSGLAMSIEREAFTEF